jgi:hypothetical protein
MSALGFLGYIWRWLTSAPTIICRSFWIQPERQLLVVRCVAFNCEHCGRRSEAPLEYGDEPSLGTRGFLICGECLRRICGLEEGARRPGESSN